MLSYGAIIMLSYGQVVNLKSTNCWLAANDEKHMMYFPLVVKLCRGNETVGRHAVILPQSRFQCRLAAGRRCSRPACTNGLPTPPAGVAVAPRTPRRGSHPATVANRAATPAGRRNWGRASPSGSRRSPPGKSSRCFGPPRLPRRRPIADQLLGTETHDADRFG